MGATACAGSVDHGLPLPHVSKDEVEIHDLEVNEGTVIEYLTDIEGNWDYLIRFVAKSKVLRWEGDDVGVWGPGSLRMQNNGLLVFGGDAPDKGPGDIRIVMTLTKLKRRYPKRVFIVLGNRDLMKLRFYAELQDVEAPDKIWMPTWDKRAKPFDTFIQECKEPNGIARDKIGKLKWLLHCTMGCQDTTFGTRKRELAMLCGHAKDEDVLDSYFSSVDPRSKNPWMLDFIKLGQVGVVIRDTLFVHGGVQDESIGRVPSKDGMCDTVQEWVDQLNAWKEEELRAYIERPRFYWKDGVQTRGGANLIEYGTPGAGKSTVIYYNPFEDGNPVLRSEKVQQYLKGSGIKRVLSGHQPHGQAPTVVRHPNTGLLVITADTSRSDGDACKLFNPADNRGAAISVVRLQGSATVIEGELANGQHHSCKIHCNPSLDPMPDALVGRQLDDGSWVKTVRLGKDGSPMPVVQAALGKGFHVQVSDVSARIACWRLRREFEIEQSHPLLSDISSRDLLSRVSLIADCLTDSDMDAGAKFLRDFTLNKEEFYKAKNYILSVQGVVPHPHTEGCQNIVNKINSLIDKGKRVIFITNNSNQTRDGLRQQLEFTYGIRLSHTSGLSLVRSSANVLKSPSEDKLPEQELGELLVITTARTCAWFLQQKGIKKPFVICSSTALLEELAEVGITNYVATTDGDGNAKQQYSQQVTKERVCELVRQAPDVDAVVVGWDQGFTALKAAVAIQYFKWSQEKYKPIPLISCSIDPSGILGVTEDDFCTGQEFNNNKVFAIGNGALTKLITHACELEENDVFDVGKPSRILLEKLKSPADNDGLGIDFKETVLIGSTLETDIAMANNGGMKSLLVLSGVTQKADVETETNHSRIPTWITQSLEDI